MESLEGVGGTTSIVDYVKQLHRAVNEGRPDFYTIPDDADLVAQLFFLYGASADPTDFEEEVDFDYQRALVRAQVSTVSIRTIKRSFRRSRTIAHDLQRRDCHGDGHGPDHGELLLGAAGSTSRHCSRCCWPLWLLPLRPLSCSGR